MAYAQYKHGQSIGRMMHYLYDGYHIYESDVWQFGDGKVMNRNELVAHIVPVDSTILDGAGNAWVGPKDEHDAPVFAFVGRMAHMNEVQAAERQKVRDAEIEDTYEETCRVHEHLVYLPETLNLPSWDAKWNAQRDLERAVKDAREMLRALVDAEALLTRRLKGGT